MGALFSALILGACNTNTDEPLGLQGFLNGEVMAYREGSDEGFYISDLNMNPDDPESYRVGQMLDLDNDGEDEQIILGPYGGMYLDQSKSDGKVKVLAEGDGTAMMLSYVFYDNACWIVISDTTHVGRQMLSLTKYAGAETVADSFELNAEYCDRDFYDETSDFTYRGEKISMERYEELIDSIFGNN